MKSIGKSFYSTNMISLAIADHNKDLEGKAEDSDNSHQLDKTKEVQENHSTQQKCQRTIVLILKY